MQALVCQISLNIGNGEVENVYLCRALRLYHKEGKKKKKARII